MGSIFPTVSHDLLDHLEREFPNTLSHLLDKERKAATPITLEQVQRALGQQQVIQVLRNHHQKQQESRVSL